MRDREQALGAWFEAHAPAIPRPSPLPGLAPPLAAAGADASSTLTTPASGASAAILPALALLLAVAWQTLQRQALQLRCGITLSIPTPPA